MPTPSDEELEPYDVRSKHALLLGVLCGLSVAAAMVCWFSTSRVRSVRSADHDGDTPYEAFLDQEFLVWWNWSWVFVIAAVVLFAGAILADAFNIHSTRLAYLMHHPPASGAEEEEAKGQKPDPAE